MVLDIRVRSIFPQMIGDPGQQGVSTILPIWQITEPEISFVPVGSVTNLMDGRPSATCPTPARLSASNLTLARRLGAAVLAVVAVALLIANWHLGLWKRLLIFAVTMILCVH
jgi:hypothetical protein